MMKPETPNSKPRLTVITSPPEGRQLDLAELKT